MPKTYPKRPLGIRLEDSPVLSYGARWEPEGANQTYPAGAPLQIIGNLLVEAASPATAIVGFSLEPGHSAPAGTKLAKFIPAIDGLIFYGNLLAAGGVDRALIQGDFGASYRLVKDLNYLGPGKPGWYLEATGTTTACKVLSFRSDFVIPNEQNDRAAIGDLNPRVGAIVLDAVRQWK